MKGIFVVEDDADLRFLYERLFEITGLKVQDHAINGNEAVKKYKSMNTKPDIIVMDYRMPNKNGIEAMEEILKMDENAIIVFISADLSIKNKAISKGAKVFLKKPFTISDIKKCLELLFPNE